MFAMFEGLFAPQHLLVIGIIAILLFGKRLPEFAQFLGKKLSEFRFRKMFRSLWESTRGSSGSDDEEPGASLARLEPPDKPRPPAQAALTPPGINRILSGPGQKFLHNP